jgi:hypothetical protein
MKYVISEVCNLKMTAFWDIAPCGPLDVDWRCRGACCLHHQVSLSWYGVSTHLWNDSKFLRDYTVQHFRRPLSSAIFKFPLEDFHWIVSDMNALFPNADFNFGSFIVTLDSSLQYTTHCGVSLVTGNPYFN